MPSRPRTLLFLLFLAAASSLVRAQSATSAAYSPVQTIDKPNGDQGWCYYCSDNDAPPLCNSQCTTAINRLCAEDLSESMTTTEQDCEIQYMPPSWEFKRNGARPFNPSESDCLDAFNGILSNCGKDAGQPAHGVNASYCTTSGGGGTFGWKDDGTPIKYHARYVVKTKGTDQCGQAQAPWQQATSVIQWDPSKSMSCSLKDLVSLANISPLRLDRRKRPSSPRHRRRSHRNCIGRLGFNVRLSRPEPRM